MKDDVFPKVIQEMGLRIALLSDTQLALLLGKKEYTKPRWRSSIESLYHVVLGYWLPGRDQEDNAHFYMPAEFDFVFQKWGHYQN